MGLFKNLLKKAAGKEIEFKVAGVTFKNGRRTRQAILRAMKYKDNGFETVEITLQRYDFEGSVAIGVYANSEQIGNVPKEIKDAVNDAWTGRYVVEEWEILGSGKEAPLGCRIKILFER